MKIRTDFVTNSSSSSFIFKEKAFNEESRKIVSKRLEELIEDEKNNEKVKRIENSDRDLYEYYMEGYYWDKAFVDGFVTRRIKDHELHEILETASWYTDDIIINIAGNAKGENSLKNIEELAVDEIRKLARFSVLKMMTYHWNMYDPFLKDNNLTLTDDEIEQEIYENILCQPDMFSEPYIYNAYILHFEEMSSFAKECAGITAGELLEEALDAKYMYLIDRYQRIDAAIVASNAKTTIHTSYGEYTVAGAISLRSRLQGKKSVPGNTDFEAALCNKMKADYEGKLAVAEIKNAKLQNTASEMRLSILGKDSKTKDEKPLEVVEAYVRENTTELVDPLDVQKKMAELKEKRETLISELETQIKVSNATTFIEF